MPTYPQSTAGLFPGFDSGLYSQMVGATQAANQAALAARTPDQLALEAQSSRDIAGLLNPPDLFPDTSRIAAEVGAGRGVGGSGAGFQIATRMTDEEKLRRMALGQQMLTAADARNPIAPPVNPAEAALSPYQAAHLNTLYDIADLRSQGKGYYAGGAPTTTVGGLGGTTRNMPGGPASTQWIDDLFAGGIGAQGTAGTMSAAPIDATLQSWLAQYGQNPTAPGQTLDPLAMTDQNAGDWLMGSVFGEPDYSAGQYGGGAYDYSGGSDMTAYE